MNTLKNIIFKFIIKLISIYYYFLKLIPTKNKKILFISRQSDTLSIDFQLLTQQLKTDDPNIKIKTICNRFENLKSNKIKFVYNNFISLYHLATSEVCILDAYWPTISLFNHKNNLTIIQMWHSIGKIKKSGYQTLDKINGRSESTANLLNMHKNYTYVIAGGEAFNEFYCKSFNIESNIIVNCGLPRIDYLIDNEIKLKNQIYETYPYLKKNKKKVILYVPTFRKNSNLTPDELLNSKDLENYIFIMKCHPLQKIDTNNSNIKLMPEYSAVDLLSIADYVITDYSAIALEAAILKKKTLYYLYDYKEYTANNGLNLDPKISMPKCSFDNAKDIIKVINNDLYDQKSLESYINSYIPKNLGCSTKSLSKLVLSNLKK